MLECKNLVKKYIGKTAVSDISLTIEPGKVYALLGPNGSGKTTLMKMIVGLTKPTLGQILIDGRPMEYKDKANITYMPTENYFFPYMSCKDICKFYSDFYMDFSKDRFVELLKEFDLDMSIKANKMSSGMMAKLKIAVALSRNSDIIMLDEPLNGIDIIARDKVLDIIQRNIDGRKSFIISSHLVDELEKKIDAAIFIKDGVMVKQGDADKLREESGKSIVDLYKEIYA